MAKSALALDANTAAQIESMFRNYSQVNAPGGSVMVIHQGKAVFTKGFGLADLERKVHCTTNTNFRLASVTKQFTAMAVLMLVERRQLTLDERLTDFFPEFPAYGKEVTVRHLLTHTSGLPDYEVLIPPGTTIPVLDQDVLRLLVAADMRRRTEATHGDDRLLTSAAAYFAPGTQYRYSNSGYALLALIVEVRSGQTFAWFLRENIFEPLKMSNTLAYEEGYAVIPNRAYGHTPKRDSLSPSDGGERVRERIRRKDDSRFEPPNSEHLLSRPSATLSSIPNGGEGRGEEALGFMGRGVPFERTDQSLTSSVLGDGGIYSSVTDLFKWDQALYKSKLVSESTLRVAFSPATPTDKPGRSYGFGWYLSEYRGLKAIWHSGETIGFRTRIVRFPEKKFTVIILANRADAKLEELPDQIADLVLFKDR
ncbi:MAG: beta-lactamase family protein [Verrucomicrobia bacterium]|nr:beta-lactamase family protein [Verrucomicrobiota bacterium]